MEALQDCMMKHVEDDEEQQKRINDKMRQNSKKQCNPEKNKLKHENQNLKRNVKVAVKDSVTLGNGLKLAKDKVKTLEAKAHLDAEVRKKKDSEIVNSQVQHADVIMSFLTSNAEEAGNASFDEKENTSSKSTTECEAERTSSLEEKEWKCLIKEIEDLKFKIKTLEQDKK